MYRDPKMTRLFKGTHEKADDILASINTQRNKEGRRPLKKIELFDAAIDNLTVKQGVRHNG